MSAHARLSASKAHRWIPCPGSIALEAKCPPDSGSDYANWGSDAHELAALCLENTHNPPAYHGKVMAFGNAVDHEMMECVQTYIDNIRQYAEGNQLFVEQRVSYASYLGVEPGEDGFGTSDAIIIAGSELQVHDLKAGRGVKVEAEWNEQMMLYALGAYDMFSLAGDFDHVRMVIHQPRLGALSEWDLPLADLLEWAENVAKDAASRVDAPEDAELDLQPGDKQCRFCPAKAICPALEAKVVKAVAGDFDELTAANVEQGIEDLRLTYNDALARKMLVVDMVEGWCKAIRARVESELLAGRAVPGYKLVEGRRGARNWRSKEEAEAVLKGMRLRQEEMYDLSLISPTTAEKLAKAGTIGPRQWPKLAELITQSEGKASVAPESDKRPALSPADDFAALAAQPTQAAHPFGRD